MVGALCLSGPLLIQRSTVIHVDSLPQPCRLVQTSSLNPYLLELINKGLQAGLAGEREWHLLLHYRENLFGGHTSEQDDPGFFMSPYGKTDPQAELDATLKQFFSEELVGRSN